MEIDADHEVIVMDDRRAFVSAASAAARADEAMINIGRAAKIGTPEGAKSAFPWYRRRIIRDEAAAIAGLEGHAIRNESLCRRIGNRDTSNLDRATKLAADIHDALVLVDAWSSEPPALEDILKLFSTSDESAGRVMRPDLVWTLEDDASWLMRECEVVHETPEPWIAVDVIRRIWISGRFQSTARRMAMLCAPWILAKGFDCEMAIHGIAQQIRKDVDGFRDSSKTSEAWAVMAALAVAEAGRANHRRIGDAAAERASLLAICPPERSSSSIGRAVEFMIGTPIFTVKSFCEGLDGLTPRGAKVVLDKLEEAGLLEVEGGSRNRNYVCRRAI
jgi:hypothetical protein